MGIVDKIFERGGGFLQQVLSVWTSIKAMNTTVDTAEGVLQTERQTLSGALNNITNVITQGVSDSVGFIQSTSNWMTQTLWLPLADIVFGALGLTTPSERLAAHRDVLDEAKEQIAEITDQFNIAIKAQDPADVVGPYRENMKDALGDGLTGEVSGTNNDKGLGADDSILEDLGLSSLSNLSSSLSIPFQSGATLGTDIAMGISSEFGLARVGAAHKTETPTSVLRGQRPDPALRIG